jgi:hypothetical protein
MPLYGVLMLPIEWTPDLEKAMDEYEEIFGEDFPAEYIGGNTEGRMARIRECIATDTPVPESEYAHLLGMV